MIEHETIEIFSSLWYKTNIISTLTIVLIIFVCSKFQDKETQQKIDNGDLPTLYNIYGNYLY